MPKRLSDPAWLAFQNDIDLDSLRLPPWGGVVQWGSQFILVYICPASGSLCQQGEAMLTDVSDRQDLIRNIPGTWDATQELWVYHLPAETVQRLAEVSKGTLEATGTIIQTVAETTGEVVGEITGPLLGNLTIPLIIAGIVLALMYLPAPRGSE